MFFLVMQEKFTPISFRSNEIGDPSYKKPGNSGYISAKYLNFK
jgi:hypothetical protein